MERDKLETKVFEALGEASMCWDKTPSGIFDSIKATKIGKDLIDEIFRLEEEHEEFKILRKNW